MFFKKIATTVDEILIDFHTHLDNLEKLIADRTQKVEQATVAEAQAIATRLAHSAEIDRAKQAYNKIKEFLS